MPPSLIRTEMWPGPGTYNPSARPRTSGAQQKKYSHESMKCNRDPRLDRLDPNSWCQHLPNVVYFQDIICRLLAWPWPALSHPVICAGRAGRGMRARVRLMIPIIRQKALFIHHFGSYVLYTSHQHKHQEGKTTMDSKTVFISIVSCVIY